MKRAAGFTLIEVLVAMVVAVAAFSILAQGFAAGGRASVSARNTTRASAVAQRVLAELEVGVRAADRSDRGAYEDEPDFAWETVVETDEPGLRLLTIHVRWDERGQERTYSLARLLREKTEAAP